MRRGLIVGLLAFFGAASAWAQTPPLEYAWSKTTSGSTRVAAWTVKSNQAGALPQLLVLGRDESAGKKPGERVRTSVLVTLEINCTNTTGRIVEQVRYDANFVETARRTQATPWVSFFQLAEGQIPAQRWCAAPGVTPPDTRTATIDAAQVWLDDMIAKPKPTPVPPQTVSFEYAGMTSDSVRVDRWLDVATMKRAGKVATVWVFEIQQAGWQTTAREAVRNWPATWFLYEFDCDSELYRGAWFAELGAKLDTTRVMFTDYNKFTALNDKNLHQIRMRTCSNRPMLFSEKYAGDIKSLAALKYGAGPSVGSTVKPQAPPVVTPVDLGPTIRISAKDKNYSYVGTFARIGTTNEYRGEFMQATGIGKYAVSLLVKGVINGELVIVQGGTITDELRMPITEGKPSGKGISYNMRDRDDYSWTLVEPTTLGVKAAPVPATPPPAPAAFQLPAVVKFREASTAPGAGVYEATWTRRGTTNLYDGAWTFLPTGQKFSDVMEVRGVMDGKFIVYRQGNKGTYSFPMVNGRPARGTASWVTDPAFYVEFVNAGTPASPAPLPPTPAAPAPLPAKNASNAFTADAFEWQFFAASNVRAIGYLDANIAADKPPRLHIVRVYAKDRQINGSPNPARAHVKSIDLDCAANQWRLVSEVYLSDSLKQVGSEAPDSRWRKSSDLLELAPVMNQRCEGTLFEGKGNYGTVRQAVTWLKTKILP